MKKKITVTEAQEWVQRLAPGLSANRQTVARFQREIIRENGKFDIPQVYVTGMGKKATVLGGNYEIFLAIIKSKGDCYVHFNKTSEVRYQNSRSKNNDMRRVLAQRGIQDARKIIVLVKGAIRFGLIPGTTNIDVHELLEIYNNPTYSQNLREAINCESQLPRNFYKNRGRLNPERVLVDFYYQITVNKCTTAQLQRRLARYTQNSGDINAYISHQANLYNASDLGAEIQRRLFNFN